MPLAVKLLLVCVLCLLAADRATAGIEHGPSRTFLLSLAIGTLCGFASLLAAPFVLCWLLSLVFRERPLGDTSENGHDDA